MKQLYFTCCLVLLAFANAFGQADTLYYNAQFQLTTQDKAVYKREATVNLATLQFDGPFRDYDLNGNLIAEGNYSNGEKQGIFKTYRNGQPESVIDFKDKFFTVLEYTNEKGQKQVSNGTGEFKMLHTYMKLRKGSFVWEVSTMEGTQENGKRIGKWVYQQAKKEVKTVEYYKNGEFQKKVVLTQPYPFESVHPYEAQPAFSYTAIERFDFDPTAFQTLHAYFQQYPVQNMDAVDRGIIFPGGMSILNHQIARLIRYPAAEMKSGVQGRVHVRFAIDENGELTDIQVMNSVSPTLDAEAMRVVQAVGHKFTPALNKGKPYKSVLTLPVTFALRPFMYN